MDDATTSFRKKEKTRVNLIQSATELLFERQGGKVSIQDITDRASVGLGTFYNYFETKQDVLDAARAALVEDFERALFEMRSRIKDPATLIAQTIRYCVRENLLNNDWIDLIRFGRFETGCCLEQPFEETLADMQLGKKSGRFKIQDVNFTAKLVSGMVRQVSCQVLNNELGIDAADHLASSVLKMVGLPDVVAQAIVKTPLPPVPVRRERKVRSESNQEALEKMSETISSLRRPLDGADTVLEPLSELPRSTQLTN